MVNNLHPDDLLFFNEVAGAMRRVAKHYNLPLRMITALPMPKDGLADRLGDCNGSGDIRLVMRATDNGVWVDNPRSPESVWGTAAHELAHLKHMNHGIAFQEFRLELVRAMANQQEDHREKVLARLVKMQASRDGEASIGNTEAAEAFASAINRMLIEHELNPSDIDYARATDRDPVIEVKVNLGAYKIVAKHARVAWQESLARIVAKAHLCTFLIRTGSNDIFFVGTKSHATVAEYTYGILVPAADKMATTARNSYDYECRRKQNNPQGAMGFREAWLSGFLTRINERFSEAREAAVVAAPEGTSTALIRLEGALIKARKYTDDKFKSKRRTPSLNGLNDRHPEGRARGRSAADAMVLGRRGVTGATQKRLNA